MVNNVIYRCIFVILIVNSIFVSYGVSQHEGEQMYYDGEKFQIIHYEVNNKWHGRLGIFISINPIICSSIPINIYSDGIKEGLIELKYIEDINRDPMENVNVSFILTGKDCNGVYQRFQVRRGSKMVPLIPGEVVTLNHHRLKSEVKLSEVKFAYDFKVDYPTFEFMGARQNQPRTVNHVYHAVYMGGEWNEKVTQNGLTPEEWDIIAEKHRARKMQDQRLRWNQPLAPTIYPGRH